MKRVIVIGSIGALALLSACGQQSEVMQNESANNNQVSQPDNNSASGENTTQDEVMIVYSDAGFAPATVEIGVGTRVVFQNNSSEAFWPASGPHPQHTNYPEFDAKRAIAPGESYSFVFEKAGSWGFHDHLDSSKFGKIEVK